MFINHVSTIVRSTDIVVYLVGGNPILARMQLQWLKCAEEDDVPAASYMFDSRTITLQHYGCDRNESLTIDTHKRMKYLMSLSQAQCSQLSARP